MSVKRPFSIQPILPQNLFPLVGVGVCIVQQCLAACGGTDCIDICLFVCLADAKQTRLIT